MISIPSTTSLNCSGIQKNSPPTLRSGCPGITSWHWREAPPLPVDRSLRSPAERTRIDAAKGTLADHVPMIVGPAPNLGVEFLNQIGSRHTKRGFNRGSDARQESFDVFLGGLSEQSPVRVTAHVLSEE